MPLLMTFTVLSFHRLNPDWKIIVYRTRQTDVELGKSPYDYSYTGKDYFYLIEPLVEVRTIDVNDFGIKADIHSIMASDMFRTRILYENGGLYSDFDVIWLRPMTDFSNIYCIGDPTDFECSVCLYNLIEGHHTISNLIAEAGSLFLKSIIEAQDEIRPPYKDCDFSTFLLNKKYPTLLEVISKYPKVLALKYETFYPYSIFNLAQLYARIDLTPLESKNVMAVHWFNGHPLSKNYTNNGFTECSMTSILKREGYI